MEAPLPTLRDGALVLRPQAEEDMTVLVPMIRDPSVRRWWGMLETDDEIREDLRNDGTAWTIEHEGEIVGWLGAWDEPTPDYRHAGLDISLLPSFQGRGIGPAALRLAARWLVGEQGHHRITIDPNVENVNAIKAYERVGFRPVGVLRKVERGPDGTWRDGLLMDMLAEELG
jgi:aminoglycoside 6'-N-acetyltransferase